MLLAWTVTTVSSAPVQDAADRSMLGCGCAPGRWVSPWAATFSVKADEPRPDESAIAALDGGYSSA
jgi:hypothetical protein